MSASHKILPHYTYDDWLHWEGKWELIEGSPIAMSPSPMPRHQQVASALNAIFYNALKNCDTCRVYQPLDYKIAEDTILIPDLLVVCKAIAKSYLDFSPALIAEILSPATALRDRHTKYQLYEQEGVQYYLIVDTEDKQVEVYMLVKSKYQRQELTSGACQFKFDQDCTALVDFSEIW